MADNFTSITDKVLEGEHLVELGVTLGEKLITLFRGRIGRVTQIVEKPGAPVEYEVVVRVGGENLDAARADAQTKLDIIAAERARLGIPEPEGKG